jgi:hypothetical protein
MALAEKVRRAGMGGSRAFPASFSTIPMKYLGIWAIFLLTDFEFFVRLFFSKGDRPAKEKHKPYKITHDYFQPWQAVFNFVKGKGLLYMLRWQ